MAPWLILVSALAGTLALLLLIFMFWPCIKLVQLVNIKYGTTVMPSQAMDDLASQPADHPCIQIAMEEMKGSAA